MPKKKDKKNADQQDENNKYPKKENNAGTAGRSASDDTERELYLIQLGYLNEQLESFQLRCDELGTQKKDLLSQYGTLQREKKDIVDYLKRCLLEKEAELEELSERLEAQQRAADQDRGALRLQHSQQLQELQDRVNALLAEKQSQGEKLASLEEFQEQREKLMSKMQSLEEQLVSQKEEHKDYIHSLEMKGLLEKKRLEMELESQMEAMAAEVQQQVSRKLPESTRRTQQENVQVKTRYGQLSEHVQALMEENAALKKRNKQLSVSVDLLEQMLSETSRKSCVQKKVVQQLTEKCQQLQVEQEDRRLQLEQLQTEHRRLLAEVEELRRDQALLTEQSHTHRADVSQLEAELREERRDGSRLKNIMKEAATTLQQVMMEAPPEQDWQLDAVIQWKQLMHKLLAVLHSRMRPSGSAAEDAAPTAARKPLGLKAAGSAHLTDSAAGPFTSNKKQ